MTKAIIGDPDGLTSDLSTGVSSAAASNLGFLERLPGFLDSFLGTGVEIAGIADALGRQDELSNTVQTGIQDLINAAQTDTRFTPFGVTSGTGNVRFDPNTGLTFNPSSAYGGAIDYSRGLATDAFGRARGALGDLNLDRTSREQGIYDRLRELQLPEEQRAQGALDRKLVAQGRQGLTTNEFGGSPEQLALSKAIQEGRNQAAVQSMEISDDQMNQELDRVSGLGKLGLLGYGGAFGPEAQLLNQFQTSNQLANILANNQANLGQIQADLGLGGLEALVGSEKISSEFISDLYGGVAGLLGGVSSSGQGGLLSSILGLFD